MVQSASSPGGIVRFGVFQLDLRSGELHKAGIRITLPDQPLAVLTALLERPGDLVTRQELRLRLWPGDTFVDFEHGLNAAVKRLRDALGDSAETPRFVETVPRRGYRFVAPVHPGPPAEHLDARTVDPLAERTQSAARTTRRGWRPVLLVAVGSVTILAAVFVAIAMRGAKDGTPQGSAAARQPEMTRLTDDAGLTWQPALSADGELLAYASDRAGDGNLDIWIQQMDGSAPIRLTRHPADDDAPSLSPEGSLVAFRSKRNGGGIYVMPAHSGGEPRLIAPAGLRPRFSPDGKWIAYHVGLEESGGDADSAGMNSLYVTSPRGGTPRRIAAEFGSAFKAVWSPDAEHILFRGRRSTAEPPDWWVVPAAGGKATRTGLADTFTRAGFSGFDVEGWLAANRLVVRGGNYTTSNIWVWPLSPASWKAGSDGQPVTTSAGRIYYLSVAGSRLVYSLLTLRAEVWSLPLPDPEGRVDGRPERQTHSAPIKGNPSLSADGSVVTFTALQAKGLEVWVRTSDTAVERRVAAGTISWPVLSRDGARIAYRKGAAQPEQDLFRIEAIPASGGSAERLCDRCGWAIPQDWSSDGRWLSYLDNQDGRMLIAALDLSTGESTPIVRHGSHNLYQGHFSSDGRWLVFSEVTAPGRSRLWVAPFRGTLVPRGEWAALTTGDVWDDKPRLSLDGSLLYFVSNRDGFSCIWGQRLRESDLHPSGAPFAVYHSHSTRLSIGNAPSPLQEISVGRDRLVFNMGELTGNIWSLPLSSVPDR